MVISKDFAKTLVMPKVISEDAYLFLQCKKNGFRFFYQSLANVFYRSPQSFRDHIKQSTRFFIGQKRLASYCHKRGVG